MHPVVLSTIAVTRSCHSGKLPSSLIFEVRLFPGTCESNIYELMLTNGGHIQVGSSPSEEEAGHR